MQEVNLRRAYLAGRRSALIPAQLCKVTYEGEEKLAWWAGRDAGQREQEKSQSVRDRLRASVARLWVTKRL